MTAPAPIVVSMGDPAGIGLEIAAKTFAARDPSVPRFALIGDADAVARAAARCGATVRTHAIETLAQARFGEALDVLHQPLARAETPGAPDPAHAQAIIAAIETGVRLTLSGAARAVVTLPIAKAPLMAAGFGFPGHTEFLADLCKDTPMPGARGPVMMLAAPGLRVALATIHAPLRSVAERLSAPALADVGRVVADALRRDFAIAQPRIALAGLNPHAGESGAIGREEIEIINPAAALLRAEGLDVRDAQPADTLFHAEARATYDAAIAMYHDQGLIPIKTLDFWGAANVTLGLPIVRASPDHGTGFDIAGRGVARIDSFCAALRIADAMAAARARA